MVGDPLQTAVYDEKEFAKWFMCNNGKRICFVSHNSYPKVNKNYNPPNVLEVRVSNMFIDFDDKDKVENAQLDAIKLIKFCQENKLPFLDSFSGSKGFHHFIRLKPANFVYDEELKIKTRAFHNWLKDKLELRTMDDKCKEPRRLCRIPYSRYAKMGKQKDYVIGDTYCHPIRSEDIMDKEITEIQLQSRNPEFFIPTIEEGRFDLNEIIEHFDIDVVEYSADKTIVDGERVSTSRLYEEVPPDDFNELVKSLIPRMCVHNDLFSRNPTHATRRMAVIQLKEIGYSFSQVVSLFEEMSKKFGWVDRMFQGRRIYQIKHIYFHFPPYYHDTCGKIKNEHGICVGEKCDKFRGW
jgi:hypothetical protein